MGDNINTGRVLRFIKRQKYLTIAFLGVLIVIVLLINFVLSSRALPKACEAHEKTVRAQISQRVFESVKAVCGNMEREVSNQTVYDENGYISRVDLDLAQINDICNSVVAALSNSFEKDPTVNIPVPVGSVTGIGVFAGKGPRIKISAYVYPAFSAKIESSFSTAGINQTLHKLTLTVYCDTVSVCADETKEISQSFDFCIMQSIIVGTVPFS